VGHTCSDTGDQFSCSQSDNYKLTRKIAKYRTDIERITTGNFGLRTLVADKRKDTFVLTGNTLILNGYKMIEDRRSAFGRGCVKTQHG